MKCTPCFVQFSVNKTIECNVGMLFVLWFILFPGGRNQKKLALLLLPQINNFKFDIAFLFGLNYFGFKRACNRIAKLEAI